MKVIIKFIDKGSLSDILNSILMIININKERGRGMGKGQFEQMLGYHCATTFKGLKAASLVCFQKADFEDFYGLLEEYKYCFCCKGISLFQLRETEKHIFMLFYRASTLKLLFRQTRARKLLRQFGYEDGWKLHELLERLQLRMSGQQGFPHEIGLFLGYPVEDVEGFIEHSGKHCIYSGYWKVYANERTTRELFNIYTHCTRSFCMRLEAGIPIGNLVQEM